MTAAETNGFAAALPRAEAISILCVLAIVNGLAADVVRSITLYGFWAAAFDTFDVSVVVVAASIVGCHLMSRSPDRAVDRLDLGVLVLCLLLIFVPHRAGSWLALTLLASYEIVRGRHSDNAVAAASIFLATAVNKFWGAFFFGLFAVPILKIDSALAGWTLEAISGEAIHRNANVIDTGHNWVIIVATGCSSVSNISAALLCWVTITRGFRPSWQWADFRAILFICTAVVALNVLRIALMGLGIEWYHVLHGPIGSNVFNIAILVVAAATALRKVGPFAPSHAADR